MYHEIFKWGLIGVYLLGTFLSIKDVGQPRKPSTGEAVGLSSIASGAIIVGLIHWL